MACPSCTTERLTAARQEGPVNDLDDGTPVRWFDAGRSCALGRGRP